MGSDVLYALSHYNVLKYSTKSMDHENESTVTYIFSQTDLYSKVGCANLLQYILFKIYGNITESLHLRHSEYEVNRRIRETHISKNNAN